jgi:hypothetical protein
MIKYTQKSKIPTKKREKERKSAAAKGKNDT